MIPNPNKQVTSNLIFFFDFFEEGLKEERTSLSPLRVNKRKLKREEKRKGILDGEIECRGSDPTPELAVSSW